MNESAPTLATPEATGNEQSTGHEQRERIQNRIPQQLGGTAVKNVVDYPDCRFIEGAIGLDDVGGLKDIKRVLEGIIVSFRNPDTMTKWGAERPQGVLLHGKPGTGKTMIAQALANEIGAELRTVQSTDIYASYLGDSEKRIKDIFERVKQVTGPTVLFFDEFDSIVGIPKLSLARLRQYSQCSRRHL